ncbi:MAG: YihY/virulence factor BrkB family protein [Bacteroidales bacterium]|nr:YihY/virulence factor BrkB family protein [Bacteroidales bacterium]
MFSKFKKLIIRDILGKPLRDYKGKYFFLIRQAKIFMMAFRGFAEDRVQVRASALTYYSILSIVPIAALAFGIAKGFGFDTFLQEELIRSFKGQENVLEWIMTFVERYLLHIKGGVIAGVGIVVLFWTVVQLLGNIESSFNDIWQIKKSRVISRKMSDYISLVVITPVLLFVSSSATIFLSEMVADKADVVPLLGVLGRYLAFLINLIPFILIWLVMTLLYMIMPNTKVKFKSALIGGIIAGTMFQFLQIGYFYFQGFITSYGAIYGSFAAFPLFLIWMQLSWLIVLFGAEISFANQNIDHYEAESESFNISGHMKKAVTLLLLREIIFNFKESLPPEPADKLAGKLDLSVRLVRDILYELQEAGIISETVTANVKENAYQPAQDLEKLTPAFVFRQLDLRGQDSLSNIDSPALNKMMKTVDRLNEETILSENNKLIHEIT